jgi:hypothetical protein
MPIVPGCDLDADSCVLRALKTVYLIRHPRCLYTGPDTGPSLTQAVMLFGFFNRVSSADQLKNGLDVGTQRTRLIADRVSKATLQNGDGFALPAENAAPGSPSSGNAAGGVDIESEMVSLADEQLRYEATAKLLDKAYQQIRISIKDR